MMRIVLTSCVFALAASLAAQNRLETFDYPDGKVPGWTEQDGRFKIENKRLVQVGTTGVWRFITRDGVKGIKHCVVDVEIHFQASPAFGHGGGVCARHAPQPGRKKTVYAQIACGGRDYFQAAMYKYGITRQLFWLPGVQRSRSYVLRMFVNGGKSWLEIDNDMDGIFEIKSKVRDDSYANVHGLVGAMIFDRVALDNWKFYEGFLTPVGLGKPKIGSAYVMEFEAPPNANTKPGLRPWLGLLSGGNKSTRLTKDEWLPIALDPLAISSVALGWRGVLSNSTPKGRLTLSVPNVKSLIGLKLWACAFAFGTTGGFGAISNAHGFQITG